MIEDPLREDAHQAIDFFVNNGVNIKVISGDNIDTVLAIAQKAVSIQSKESSMHQP
ncbi:hypothetical protein MGH68_06055 [Erysipelothrix sp. D19-032]